MGATAPLIVAVDDDAALLADVERELRNRYQRDYRVCCLDSLKAALRTLEELAAAGEQVALVLAAERLAGAPGTDLLAQVRHRFPHAQRVLLIGYGRLGNADAGDAIFEAIAGGRMDHYALRPALPPDEQFHQAISSFLLRWAETQRRTPYTIDVIGETWSGRAYEMRAVLERCAMPHRFLLAGSEEGRARLAGAGARRSRSWSCPTGASSRTPATWTSRGRRAPPSPPTGTTTTW